MMRAIRGAICVASNTFTAIESAVTELVTVLVHENRLALDDIVSALFSLTPDLNAAFPAQFARELGWSNVPMMCSQEIDVPGALRKVCRVIVHVHGREPARHVYLRGAEVLRPDLLHARAKVLRS